MDEAVYTKTEEFFQAYTLVRIRKGQALLAAGQEIPEIFWMKEGLIRMYQISDDGTETTMNLFQAPSFFPMMFYLSHRRTDYYFQAVEDVVARKAPASEVVDFLKANPDVLFDLTTRFADAITGLLLRIDQLSSQNAYQRVCSLLLYLADKFGETDGDECTINLPLGHEDIAHWVGVVRETVSHQMERLAKDGIVTTRNRKLVILDFERLASNSK